MTSDRFLRACRREYVDRTPIWLMRQAGRYMPEYRAIRESVGFLDLVHSAELAAEVTLQPVRAFAIDAAIIFADILPPLVGIGFDLTFEKGDGPVIHNPVRTAADIAALRPYDAAETNGATLAAIGLVRRELGGLPLIGFAGAPFTLASYAIEGGASREFRRVKYLMYGDSVAWHALMTKLSDLTIAYLVAQAQAGVDALQLFDSWVGALGPVDYAEYVQPHVQRIIDVVRAATIDLGAPPIIYFAAGGSGLLGQIRQLGADVAGVDWRIALDDAWAQLGPQIAVQGNLDPHTLFAPWETIARRTDDILARAAGRPGHIFNLGHGILTETPVDHVRRLCAHVHETTG